MKYNKKILEVVSLLEFSIKLFMTLTSMFIFGIAGYMFSRLFKMSLLWTLAFTLGSSAFITAYLTWWCNNLWNFMYDNCIKQYLPKKKKRMRVDNQPNRNNS